MSQPEIPPLKHKKRACERYGCQQVHLIYDAEDPAHFFCIGIAKDAPKADDHIMLCIGARDDEDKPGIMTWGFNRVDAYILIQLLGEALLALEDIEVEERHEDVDWTKVLVMDETEEYCWLLNELEGVRSHA